MRFIQQVADTSHIGQNHGEKYGDVCIISVSDTVESDKVIDDPYDDDEACADPQSYVDAVEGVPGNIIAVSVVFEHIHLLVEVYGCTYLYKNPDGEV